MGRTPHKNRDGILRDLADFDLNVKEIASKNKASESLVATVGRENGLDMALRLQIVRTMAKIFAMVKTVRLMKVRFLADYPEKKL
jgi:hypothetical protein